MANSLGFYHKKSVTALLWYFLNYLIYHLLELGHRHKYLASFLNDRFLGPQRLMAHIPPRETSLTYSYDMVWLDSQTVGKLVLARWNGDLLFLGIICESVTGRYALVFEISMIGCVGVETRIMLGLT